MNHKEVHISLVTILMLLHFSTVGQVCDGTFGNNIFDDGDFGSGTPQVVANDPGIAPGYQYTATLPPSDGFYTLANLLERDQIFDSWLPIKDNSADPNGYMMVVNATFEPGLFYQQTITDLCEDVVYQFSADIFNLNAAWATDRILPNVSFLINGEEVFSTGLIPRNERWNTYSFEFTIDPGETSLLLSLRNNAPGGTGNDLALDNITFRPCGSEALILPQNVANICEDGDPIELQATIVGSAFENTFIQWQQSFDEGLSWVDIPGETNDVFNFDILRSGFYYYRFLLADSELKLLNARCRTFSNTKVINVIPKFNKVTDSVCIGRSVPFDGVNLLTSGIYIDTLQNIVGCDSIVTFNLSMVENDLSAVFQVEDPSCSYLSDGSIEIETLSSLGPYDVKVDFMPLNRPWKISELDSGKYKFLIIDKYGCALDTNISLVRPPPFIVNLGPDKTLALGQTLELNNFVSEPAAEYLWSPESIECEPPCDQVNILLTEDLIIKLEATSFNNCVAEDQLQITVEEELVVFIPNVITPNNDDRNEFFTVFTKEGIEVIDFINNLSVYTRDGIKVFEKSFILPGVKETAWHGTFNERSLPSGVYYYFAQVTFINGEELNYRGSVSILK